jgi:ribosomal protein S18 acetylase RimI-like enzyme
MSKNLHVRIATRDDAKKIAEFNVIFAKETENKNIQLQVTEKGVDKVFSKFNNGFYLVAEEDDKIVGLCMITREWSDWNDAAFYCIQNTFSSHREDEDEIHKALIEKAKQLAKDHDEICGIRMYVHKDDTQTQKQYESFGMQKTVYRLFEETFN